jgi:hypothetical protein
LPFVVATVSGDGMVLVTVDGATLMEGPIDRGGLGRVLSAIADDRGTAIRAEVHEPDGRVYADVIEPPARRSRFAPPPDAVSSPVPPSLWEVSGYGFVPGEDVAVAVIVSRTSASGQGGARALLEQAKAPGGVGDVLLFGEISGTLVRQDPRR